MKKIFSIMIIILLCLQLTAVFAEEEYYVQVGAFESKNNAEKYEKYMESIGYEAEMIQVYDLYKVFLGPYSTEEKAREIMADYKSVGGSGFFVVGSQMYYQPPVKEETEVVEETTEETVEETTEESTEETVEETTEETTEETVEETTEETDEETVEETTEEVAEEEIEVKVVEVVEPEEDNSNYKLFTIVLIVVLWMLFVISIVVFRLNQNKNNVE